MEIVNFDKPDEFQAAMAMIERELSNLVKLGAIRASIRKAYYDACVEQGFSEEQALHLTANYDYVRG